MGFFYNDPPKAARSRKTIPLTLATLGGAAKLDCSSCTLDKAKLDSPKIPPTGAERPVVYILGEAPGKQEDEQGVQFVGASGELLRGVIPSRWEKRIRWNNTIRCRPPENRDPTGLEVECCRSLQTSDIERSAPQVIMAFGNVPLHWFAGSDRSVYLWRGRRCPVKIGKHTAWLYPIVHPSAILHAQNDKKKGEAFRQTFMWDVQRVFKDLEDGLPDPVVEDDFHAGVISWQEYGADGLARIEKELEEIRDSEHSVDIETNALRPYFKERAILTMAVGTYDRVFAFPWLHPEAQWTPKEKERIGEMVEAYLLGSGMKWTHNARFEQEWFNAHFGPKVLYETRWGDTLGQAHVIDERRGKALDDLTQIHFGFRLKALSNIDVANIAREPLRKVLPYNGMDSKYCHALSVVQGDELERIGLAETYEFMNSQTPSFVQMQSRGVVRNMPAIIGLDKQLKSEREAATVKILSDKDVRAFPRRTEKFATSPQNQVAFFRDHLKIQPEKTRNSKGGKVARGGSQAQKYSVDDEALEQIKHPVARLILDLRSLVKRHGYVEPLLDKGKYVHGDGLIHASYSQFVTVTGRSSCEEPNQQNYPRREHKEIRRVVGCPPDCKFVSFDYGQLEARIVAAISGCPVLGAEIHGGADIHGMWTDLIGGEFVPKQVKENRKKVRDSIKQSWTFANFYGNVLEAVAWDLSRAFGREVSPRALAPFFEDFWTRYKVVHQWQDSVMATYWQDGMVEHVFGQRRRGPMNRNEIINHPIQGSAGQIVIDAQRRISRIAYEQGIDFIVPIMNVHDDLSFYIPNRELEPAIEFIAKEMTCTPFDWITVPLTVEVAVGSNWCDKEEIGTFSTKDFA